MIKRKFAKVSQKQKLLALRAVLHFASEVYRQFQIKLFDYGNKNTKANLVKNSKTFLALSVQLFLIYCCKFLLLHLFNGFFYKDLSALNLCQVLYQAT